MSQLPVEILSEQEVQRLISHPDAADIFGLRDAAILSVLYYAAATAGEVTTLNIADTDWNDGILRLQPDLGRPRQVLIEEPLAHMLNHYLEESRKPLLAHGGGTDAGALRAAFVTNKGPEWVCRTSARSLGPTARVRMLKRVSTTIPCGCHELGTCAKPVNHPRRFSVCSGRRAARDVV